MSDGRARRGSVTQGGATASNNTASSGAKSGKSAPVRDPDDDGEVLLIRSKMPQHMKMMAATTADGGGGAGDLPSGSNSKPAYFYADPAEALQSAAHQLSAEELAAIQATHAGTRSISPATAAILSSLDASGHPVSGGSSFGANNNSGGSGGRNAAAIAAAASSGAAVAAAAAAVSSAPLVVDATSSSLPELSDVVFQPEKVNAHTFFNSWVVQDETRNFAFLRKEKKALVTFQCRIIVKGAKHIQLQVAAGPSVEFLLPTWILVRYVQSELLPPCLFEDYNLVEMWMKAFVVEVKSLAARTDTAMGAREAASATSEQRARMTRHLVHAAAAVVNAQDLFLGLISAARDQGGNGGGGGGMSGNATAAGGGGGGRLFLMSGNNPRAQGSDSDDDAQVPAGAGGNNSTSGGGGAAAKQQHQQQQGGRSSVSPAATPKAPEQGLFSRLLGGGGSKNKDEQQQQRGGSAQGNGQQQQPQIQSLQDLTPAQQQIVQKVQLHTLIPTYYRTLPNPLTLRTGFLWALDLVVATLRTNTREDYRARFFVQRPQTKDEYSLQEVLREQAKENRKNAAMVFMFVFLMVCRFVSLDLFLILAGVVLYGTRYVFTEYKSIFIFFTKRTARSRVNRVKDWFTFGVRRKSAIEPGADPAATAAAAAAAAAADEHVDFEDWDIDD